MIHLSILALLWGPSTLAPALKVDPLQLAQAAEIWSVIGTSHNPVWPGWDARKTPILIYLPGKQDVLVNHPHPPVGFVRYSGPVRSPIGPIYVKDGPTILDMDGQNTSLKVGDTMTLVVADTLSTRRQWVEGLVPLINGNPMRADQTIEQSITPDPYGAMVMFAHEAFHVYQHKMAGEKGGNELDLEEYPSLSVQNNVEFAIESDCLAKAIHAKSANEVRKAAVEWLAVRQDRRAAIGKQASDYEDGTEFSEGTAKYVEFRTLQALEGRKPSHDMWLAQGFSGYGDLSKQRNNLIQAMRSSMSGEMVINNDLYGSSPVRYRLYYSGMGVAALLDRLNVEWHTRIFEPSATLTEIAQEALDPSAMELQGALAEVKNSERYKELTASKNKLAEDGLAYIDGQVRQFQQAPAQLVLDYSRLAKPNVAFSFTPFGILRIDSDRTIFRLVPIRGKIDSVAFSEEGALPVLQDRQSRRLIFQLSGPLDGPTIAKQAGVSILDGSYFSATSIHLPGIELKDIKGKIARDGNTLRIEL
jgi:hypothetical protein